jgi:ketosteroid isomerase-like protein
MMAMRKGLMACSLTLSLLGIPAAVFAADAATALAEVEAADVDWVKAYNAGDLETVVGSYEEHATVYPPGSPPVHGAAAIRTYFTKDNADFVKGGLSFVLGAKPSGGVSGKLGWASGTYEIKDKTGHVVDKGWYFSISKKVGGKWLYIRDAFNSDGPPPKK